MIGALELDVNLLDTWPGNEGVTEADRQDKIFSHRKLQQNNYAATMASAARRQISGGGALINKNNRDKPTCSAAAGLTKCGRGCKALQIGIGLFSVEFYSGGIINSCYYKQLNIH